MTCIVGVETPDGVLIGGDSAGVSGWSLTVRSDDKVFTVGPYVMGFTTSFRMGQLLRYSLQVGPPDTWDVDRFMATTFVDAVRATLKDGGWAATDSSRERGGTFLVGVCGRLYEVESDYQVGRAASGFAAVGCGAELALGSLHTSSTHSDADPDVRVAWALEAAAALNAGVSAPFTFARSAVA